MAEPVVVIEINEASEGTPTWTAVDTALRWVGPDSADGALTDPFPAPAADGDDAFFDSVTAPNDGELWHETAGTDVQITVPAGRNTNRNVLRARETGTDATVDPPEFTAYDDATDAANRTAPTIWLLVGTTGSSSISQIRGIETTNQAPGGPWTGQVHDADPGTGTSNAPADLEGDISGSKVVCTTVLATSGSKTFNLAACAPHDATSGLTTFVYCFQYTYV